MNFGKKSCGFRLVRVSYFWVLLPEGTFARHALTWCVLKLGSHDEKRGNKGIPFSKSHLIRIWYFGVEIKLSPTVSLEVGVGGVWCAFGVSARSSPGAQKCPDPPTFYPQTLFLTPFPRNYLDQTYRDPKNRFLSHILRLKDFSDSYLMQLS